MGATMITTDRASINMPAISSITNTRNRKTVAEEAIDWMDVASRLGIL